MASSLFEFYLTPIDQIAPWRSGSQDFIHWFALSDGILKLNVGTESLLQSTPQLQQARGWQTADLDYYLAAMAPDVLSRMSPTLAPLPPPFERLASHWPLVQQLELIARPRPVRCLGEPQLVRAAWNWLNERSPAFDYFQRPPHVTFLRLGEDVHICWDNREMYLDGLPHYTAQCGKASIPAAAFEAECRSFAARLLHEMNQRVSCIEAGQCHPTVQLDPSSLRQEQATWEVEFQAQFKPYTPEIPWEDAALAMRTWISGLETPLREQLELIFVG